MSQSPKAVAPYEEEYVCALDEDTQWLAENELRETAEIRDHALKFVRDWMDHNPKILKCRYDSSFLLRFLRTKKFSLPIVQLTLERYLMLRECYQDAVFARVSLEKEPNVADLLDRGLVFPLPKRDPQGRRVLIIQPRVFDCNRHAFRDLIRLFTITTDILMEDEGNQIRGFVYLIDAQSTPLQLLTLVTPKEAVNLLRNGEALVPMRHCLGVGYNIPSALKFAVDFALNFLSEKLRSRARQVTDLRSCPEIDPEILPKELGKSDLSIQDMIDLWKKEIDEADVTHFLRQNDEMRANLHMFTKKEAEGNFKKPSANPDESSCGCDGVPGSFRKLEVD